MDNMTIEDIEEYKKNAIEILRKNSQYATAKATEEAFDLLIEQTRTTNAWNKILETAPLFYLQHKPSSIEEALERLKQDA